MTQSGHGLASRLTPSSMLVCQYDGFALTLGGDNEGDGVFITLLWWCSHRMAEPLPVHIPAHASYWGSTNRHASNRRLQICI